MHTKITHNTLKGINEKNYAAWEELYTKFYRALCSSSLSIVRDNDVAQDVVQDVLMKVWQSSVSFDNERDLIAYLYRAVYNNSLIHLRNQGSRADALLQLYNAAHERVETGSEYDFFAEIISEEVIRELYSSIAELPDSRQEVIKLSIEGKTGQEIAKMLGVSLNTVKTQKYRGYKYLKERLKRFFGVVVVSEE